MNHSLISRSALAALLGAVSGMWAPTVFAATLTWDGDDTGNLMSEKKNWDPPSAGAPATNDLLVFPDISYTAVGGTPINNLAPSVSLAGLVFQQSSANNLSIANPFYFNGAPITGAPSNGATVSLSGSGNVNLSDGVRQTSAASDVILNVTGTGNLTLGPITNAAGLVKNGAGAGAVILDSTANAYTGTTTINAGTLQLGRSDVLPANKLILAGGTLNTGGFSDTVGKLDLDTAATKVINMNEAGALVFSNSADQDWQGTLQIWNWKQGTTSIRFDTNDSGLNYSTQLTKISIYDGPGATNFLGTGDLDAGGFLVVVPEPGAVLAGLSLLGAVAYRERRHFFRVRAARA